MLTEHFPGAELICVSGRADFEQALMAGDFAAVITEYQTGWTNGLWINQAVRDRLPFVPVIMLTRSGSEEIAVAGMKAGLSDYILKGNPSRLPASLRESLHQAQERQTAERQLQQAEVRFRTLVEQIPAITYISDATETGRVRYVSPQIEELLGYSIAEWLSEPGLWFRLVYPDDREKVLAEMKRSADKGEPFISEYRLRTRDGRVIWSRDQAVIVRDAEGQPLFLQGVIFDITERRQMETERQRLYERVRDAHDRLKLLSRQLIAAQENERRRIARELHDQLGQALTALKINLQTCLRKSLPAEIAEQLEDSLRLTDSSLQQVRDLSLELRPSLLDDLGLVSALRWYLDRLAHRAGLNAEFAAADCLARLPTEIETTCFRVAQEALTNVIRHAQARRVRIELQYHEQQLQLIVSDDGIGFDAEAAMERAARGGSLGLPGMQERVSFTGGSFEITSGAMRGTEVRASFPLPGI